MHQSVQDAFLPFSEPLEGRIHFMYLVSTGVGNLLDADNPRELRQQPAPLTRCVHARMVRQGHRCRGQPRRDWAGVPDGQVQRDGICRVSREAAITRLRITDDAINTLVVAKLMSFESTLRGRPPFANLDGWPADAQLGLFSMAWAMGPLFHFPQFEAAAAAEDWLTMAHECKISEAGDPGIIGRNVRNELLFTLANSIAAPPPGEFSALVFDPSLMLDENMRSGNFPIPLNLAIGLQTALEMLGFDPNGLDGVFGRDTRTALTQFQTDNNLTTTRNATMIDDVPQETIDALAAALDANSVDHFPYVSGRVSTKPPPRLRNWAAVSHHPRPTRSCAATPAA